MPYQQLEELQSRRREKVAMFLTAEQLFGVLIVVVPVYLGTAQFMFWMRATVLLAGATLGLLLTSDVEGLPLYERLLWRLRGTARLLVAGRTVSPQHLVGTVSEQPERPLPVNSPIRLLRDGDLVARRRSMTVQQDAALVAPTVQPDLAVDVDAVARSNGNPHAHV